MKKHRRWRYRLTAPYALRIPELDRAVDHTFVHPWFMLDPDGLLTIHSAYAWDGASCYFEGRIMRHWPELFECAFLRADQVPMPRTWTRASCVHDVVYQYIKLLGSDAVTGLGRRKVRHIADRVLARIGKHDGARDSWAVYIGVRVGGGVYHAVMGWWRNWGGQGQ